jgi:hypothetical protein
MSQRHCWIEALIDWCEKAIVILARGVDEHYPYRN